MKVFQALEVKKAFRQATVSSIVIEEARTELAIFFNYVLRKNTYQEYLPTSPSVGLINDQFSTLIETTQLICRALEQWSLMV